MQQTRARASSGPVDSTRRSLLKLGAAAALSTTFPTILLPKTSVAAIARTPERRLHLHLAHTGEIFDGIYWSRGHYVNEAMSEINRLFRDRHNAEVIAIDPKLLDTLAALRKRLETRTPFEVVCGYRSPETNEALYEEGEHVAKNSYHIKGMAVDIRCRDRDLHHLYRAAKSLRSGGVGYYGRAKFIHVDVGAVRTW